MTAVAFFSMEGLGHLKRLRPLISGVAARGAKPYVFTDPLLREIAEAAGGRFVDLFAGRPMERESLPRPIQNVTFAGEHAEALAAEARALGVELVVYDTFAVVGRAVGHALGVPSVNVCAGHGVDPAHPERYPSLPADDPRRRTSERCLRAVEILRERYGIADASPLSYLNALSPHLNVYCEPEPFLDPAVRSRFEPVAFLGSLAPDGEDAVRDGPPVFAPGAATKAYVSFGTIAWRYYAEPMLAALRAIAAALAARPGTQTVVSAGGSGHEVPVPAGVRALPWVDQWRALGEADLFVTHHGLNSTHEAIWHAVPMVGYPLLGDQPAQAETCARLGVSVPLARSPRAAIDEAAVHAALDAVEQGRTEMAAALAAARAEEERVIARRDEVVERILALRG